MVALSESLIRETYKKLKEKADYYLDKGKIQKGLLYTHLAANTNYAFWLSYYDEEIEDLAKRASKTIRTRDYNNEDMVRGRCVMLDSLARYRGGLTIQYVNAIVSAGWELLYITGQEIKAPHHLELYDFLIKLKGVQIIEIPSKMKGIVRLQYIYDSILNYRPERIFFHCTTTDSFFSAVMYSLPSTIEKFYIDMADHGFRMGVNSCDYAFEFRDLGCSIVTQYMYFPKERILMLPFYPNMDKVEFKGFPSQCEGKVVILSGGIFWKIVDKEDTFFKLCQKILQQNPNSIILYPGNGDPSYVINKIKEYGMEDGFLLLGWRDDIYELFQNSDIFLNTYPHVGGTMSQYAAHSKIPILSYRSPGPCVNPVEDFVCQKGRVEISSIGEKAFLDEAHRLIEGSDYRREKAERIYSCIINQNLFNQYFKEMSESHKNLLPFESGKNVDISHDRLEKQIRYHNATGGFQLRLVSLAGINSITMRPEYLVPFVKHIIPKFKRVFKERGFHFNRL